MLDCLGFHFQNTSVLLRRQTSSKAFLVLLVGACQCIAVQRYFPNDKHNGHRKNLWKRPPGSGGLHFEITVESHVATVIHAIVQGIFKTKAQTSEQFSQYFWGLIFGSMGRILENCENYEYGTKYSSLQFLMILCTSWVNSGYQALLVLFCFSSSLTAPQVKARGD